MFQFKSLHIFAHVENSSLLVIKLRDGYRRCGRVIKMLSHI